MWKGEREITELIIDIVKHKTINWTSFNFLVVHFVKCKYIVIAWNLIWWKHSFFSRFPWTRALNGFLFKINRTFSHSFSSLPRKISAFVSQSRFIKHATLMNSWWLRTNCENLLVKFIKTFKLRIPRISMIFSFNLALCIQFLRMSNCINRNRAKKHYNWKFSSSYFPFKLKCSSSCCARGLQQKQDIIAFQT